MPTRTTIPSYLSRAATQWRGEYRQKPNTDFCLSLRAPRLCAITGSKELKNYQKFIPTEDDPNHAPSNPFSRSDAVAQ